ncbi:MAG: SDR family oxidoreductase [Cycloclasticus sp.]
MEKKEYYGFSNEELLTIPTVYAADLFKNKTVLISGAGSGIGKANAVLFARLGANIVLCGRTIEKLKATEELISQFSGKHLSVAMTIRDPEQVSNLMDTVWQTYGQLDVLINNGGGQYPQKAIDFSVKGWNAVIDTNLNGSWYMMQQAAKRWIENNQEGNIVNIVANFMKGMPGIAHTCAARAAVTYLSKTLSVEWAEHNIRVNCVSPGCVETEGFNVYPDEGRESFSRSNPMLRVGDAHDIAEGCVYMAAPSGKFITGEMLNIDGGQQQWGEAWPAGKPDYFKLPGE